MYAKGMSTRDIEDHMRDIYGIDVSAGMVSKVTDKIMPLVAEWQGRPLERIIPEGSYFVPVDTPAAEMVEAATSSALSILRRSRGSLVSKWCSLLGQRSYCENK